MSLFDSLRHCNGLFSPTNKQTLFVDSWLVGHYSFLFIYCEVLFFSLAFYFGESDKVCLTNRLLKNGAVDSYLNYFHAKAVTIKFESNLT